MKKRSCGYFVVLGLACVFLAASVSAASVTVTGNVEAGYLTINRFPALGGGITAFITIDGESAGRIRWGEHYHRSLVPGDHFISIMVYPNHMVLTPAEKRVSVQSGQSYMFTLKWNGDRLVLMQAGSSLSNLRESAKPNHKGVRLSRAITESAPVASIVSVRR